LEIAVCALEISVWEGSQNCKRKIIPLDFFLSFLAFSWQPARLDKGLLALSI
jgi:hypothetical protein